MAGNFQVWTLGIPKRGCCPVDEAFTEGDATYHFRGQEIVPEIHFNPLAGGNGLIERLDVKIFAPPMLAPQSMNPVGCWGIGAIAMPSPHQATVWPTFLEVTIAGEVSTATAANRIDRLVSERWQLKIPIAAGFRRVLHRDAAAVDTSGPPKVDALHRIRDFGCNDVSEYEDKIPGGMAYPGSLSSCDHSYAWSCVFAPSLAMPASKETACQYAEHLQRILTSLGNIWIYSRHSMNETEKVELTCRCFASVVEGAAYAVRGKSRCKKDVEACANPVSGMFQGSDSVFVKLMAISFESIPQLKRFLYQNRSSAELLAKYWHTIRNPEGHEPGPAIVSVADVASRRHVGSSEANSVAVAALKMGLSIVDSLNLFPTTALK